MENDVTRGWRGRTSRLLLAHNLSSALLGPLHLGAGHGVALLLQQPSCQRSDSRVYVIRRAAEKARPRPSGSPVAGQR